MELYHLRLHLLCRSSAHVAAEYGPNIPIFEGGELAGFFSPPHKYPTGRPLTYNGAPDRGAYWFERTMAEHKDDVIREAAALAGGRPGK